ncbi:hypothetical protein ABIA39_008521 [Nocardia sp. GAS34]|uniref:acyltransferase family protein n=1 Tax=unclassified Nocardia TaxID=2637762 RepID=UPI003D1A0C12
MTSVYTPAADMPSGVSAAGSRRLPSLTAARWWAACAVLVSHALILLPTYPFQKTELFRRIHQDFVPMQFGAAGVTFFFVLSGFIIYWSAGHGGSALSFYRRRVLKIYPTHLIAGVAFKLPTRVAALLMLLYAQPLTRVLRLTIGDVLEAPPAPDPCTHRPRRRDQAPRPPSTCTGRRPNARLHLRPDRPETGPGPASNHVRGQGLSRQLITPGHQCDPHPKLTLVEVQRILRHAQPRDIERLHLGTRGCRTYSTGCRNTTHSPACPTGIGGLQGAGPTRGVPIA